MLQPCSCNERNRHVSVRMVVERKRIGLHSYSVRPKSTAATTSSRIFARRLPMLMPPVFEQVEVVGGPYPTCFAILHTSEVVGGLYLACFAILHTFPSDMSSDRMIPPTIWCAGSCRPRIPKATDTCHKTTQKHVPQLCSSSWGEHG